MSGAEATGKGRRALLVDYDGVIVDSERLAAEAIVHFLADRGVAVEAGELGYLFGSTESDAMWFDALRSWLGDDEDLAVVDAAISELVRAKKAAAPLLPGVHDLLARARRGGWLVGLATGARRVVLLPELERHGLADQFDVIVTAEDVTTGKPAPDVFLAAAAALGVDPSDCVVVEDSTFGCEAGLAAGMTVIACPCAITVDCSFPAEAQRVSCLDEIDLSAVRG